MSLFVDPSQLQMAILSKIVLFTFQILFIQASLDYLNRDPVLFIIPY